MEQLISACQLLLAVAIAFVLGGVYKMAAFFMSDDWDPRPQWQREADFYASLIPDGAL